MSSIKSIYGYQLLPPGSLTLPMHFVQKLLRSTMPYIRKEIMNFRLGAMYSASRSREGENTAPRKRFSDSITMHQCKKRQRPHVTEVR